MAVNANVRISYYAYCTLVHFKFYHIFSHTYIYIQDMYTSSLFCVLDLSRYGGFSFGDEDPLAAFNATELKIVIDELLTVLNNGTAVNSFNETQLIETIQGLATQRVNKVIL